MGVEIFGLKDVQDLFRAFGLGLAERDEDLGVWGGGFGVWGFRL